MRHARKRFEVVHYVAVLPSTGNWVVVDQSKKWFCTVGRYPDQERAKQAARQLNLKSRSTQTRVR